MIKKELSKVQQAKIYCIKHGHAKYVTKSWGYVYCGRCGEQLGDQLGSVYSTEKTLVIGCKLSPCDDCDPIKEKLNEMDKKILSVIEKEGQLSQEEILIKADFKGEIN